MAALTSAADCSLPQLNARGLHALDLAEAAADMEGTAGFAQLAQAYFQAVTAAMAMTIGGADETPDAIDAAAAEAAFREMGHPGG